MAAEGGGRSGDDVIPYLLVVESAELEKSGKTQAKLTSKLQGVFTTDVVPYPHTVTMKIGT